MVTNSLISYYSKYKVSSQSKITNYQKLICSVLLSIILIVISYFFYMLTVGMQLQKCHLAMQEESFLALMSLHLKHPSKSVQLVIQECQLCPVCLFKQLKCKFYMYSGMTQISSKEIWIMNKLRAQYIIPLLNMVWSMLMPSRLELYTPYEGLDIYNQVLYRTFHSHL